MLTTQTSKGSHQPSEAEKNAVPAIQLPKGGGAIRGIGEKFAANPVTGTGSMTVPIATSPGRSGFGPQLSLSYDSGSGNGPFGLGWSLSLPSITRKTDKGLPRYLDAEESDTFLLSGAEDLVPVLVKNQQGQWEAEEVPPRIVGNATYDIRRYRPRIEGLFARIERWTNQAKPEEMFWRSISKDNITTWYGKTSESRIADPADPTHIFSWLISESYDDKGNVMVYRYTAENGDYIDLAQAHERNRTAQARTANRYLKRIVYGNRQPYFSELKAGVPWSLPPAPLAADGAPNWFFEVVFDYDDGHYTETKPDARQRVFAQARLSPTDDVRWPRRLDSFSSYRAGFEIRTYRLCQRVLMFHHFPAELGVPDCLVRSTEFTYSYEDHPEDARNPIFSCLQAVRHSGYTRQQQGTYLKQSLPSVEFTYTTAEIQADVRELDPNSAEHLPSGLDGATYQWVDLDGEGLSGILTEQAEGWFYKRNLSPLPVRTNGSEEITARFAPVESVLEKPSLAALHTGRQQFLDLSGDGQLDLVDFQTPTPGFYERTADEQWEAFRPFASLPNLAWNDPNLKFVDLTGDGHADILLAKDDSFTWYPSLAEDGFGVADSLRKVIDEEQGPAVLFADGTQSVYLADMSGDGLTDIVRIRNGEVCYWPNLGYGRFGAKVTMDNAPWFDNPDQFDHRRIRLADVDGSGVTDILYLGRAQVQVFFNHSGNAWAAPQTIPFPKVDSLTAVQAVDLLGNGTACLVWSSPLPNAARTSMRYVDLMGGQKPHLLVQVRNNLGAETVVTYAPSTKFYLADKEAGNPWITKLPFPVHVVERVDTYDRISWNHFVTRYAYHHGYFDGVEREFRGFGMVEQWDTEAFATLTAEGKLTERQNVTEASHVPPVLTKTWFHTGAYTEGGRISRHYEEAYYRESDLSQQLPGLSDAQWQALGMVLDDTILPTTTLHPDNTRTTLTVSAEEAREACRALKGAILRQEVYALDETEASDRPYSVSERNYTIEVLQPQGAQRHAVFLTHPHEIIDIHYERKLLTSENRTLADPRLTHALTLAVDAYGNVLRSVAINYRRRNVPEVSEPEQHATHLTLTVNRFTNCADAVDWYRIGAPVETRTYDVVKPPEPAVIESRIALFRFETIQTVTEQLFPADAEEPSGATLWPYEKWDWRRNVANAPAETRLRLIEHVRTLYRRDDLSGPLPLGTVQALALPYDSYKLAFTSALLSQVYKRTRNGQEEMLLADLIGVMHEGGYVDLDGNGRWWIPLGQVFYWPNGQSDPAAELAFARAHFFLPHRFHDPFGNTIIVGYDTATNGQEYNLLVTSTRDPVGNEVRAEHDYRVLQPTVVTDPNHNRSAVIYDALGLVVGTAVMGKAGENKGDLLDDRFLPDLDDATVQEHLTNPLADPHDIVQNATTRLVYDLFAYQRTKDDEQPQPAVVYTLARETHHYDLAQDEQTKVQHSFSYSDGFGREIQKKIQAEPGPIDGVWTDPRWVGSGWTIFNNKGKPVRQYEPFFSPTHYFQFGATVGVSPILLYDPLERVVATLHPNHTYEKVVFDPWRQITWDVNDTVGQADPTADPDVGPFLTRLPEADYTPTWRALRADPLYTAEALRQWPDAQMRAAETNATAKAAVHADTPTVAYTDTLGQTFLTVAHNKFVKHNALVEEKYATRLVLDAEGNQRAVIDAKGRVVMRYDYDMLGNRIHQASMEAGERWMLNDVTGKPIRRWDSRGHTFTTEYDRLRRPVRAFVAGTDAQHPSAQTLYEKTEYGEDQPNDLQLNLRTHIFRLCDGAGQVTNEAYDFKGNLLRSSRRLALDYTATPDWSTSPDLELERFTTRTVYDALNRPVEHTTPDTSITRPTYNEANLLNTLSVNLRGVQENNQPKWTTFVANIDYNAKGQRERIEYGNGVRTTYTYDRETFRLMHLQTLRSTESLQDLHYTYDPAGNITSIRDTAQQTIYFDNQVVEPQAEYTYDALYRLIIAEGREHRGQVGQPQYATWSDEFRVHLPHPQNGQAMRRYTEQYEYDEVGNILNLIHQAQGGDWTRSYTHEATSLLESAYKSNRLTRTTVNGTTEQYTYDVHGNMTSMPHLARMDWDCEDQLQRIDLGGGGVAYYVYDAHGQRVRKVIDKQNGMRQKERIYLGGYEVYREYDGNGAAVTLERQTLQVMDDKQRLALVETKTMTDHILVIDPRPFTRYQLSNHLGSSIVEVDGQAQIISYEEYYPYGSTSYQAVSNQIETPKCYRYTGKERDEESGLYYHGARYYAPWLGRWTSCDPIGLKSDINLYEFAKENPINHVDRNGYGDLNLSCPPEACKKIEDTSSPEELKAFLGGFASNSERRQEAKKSDISQRINDTVSNASQRIEGSVGRQFRALRGTASDVVRVVSKAIDRAGAKRIAGMVRALTQNDFERAAVEYSNVETLTDPTRLMQRGADITKRIVRILNYGGQFLDVAGKGGGPFESLVGAAGGGLAGNRMGSLLLGKGGGPGLSAFDASLNIAHNTTVVFGAPNEAQLLTGGIVSLTPSQFGTSLGRNSGRFLVNFATGILSGDWSNLQRQKINILEGREGTPLQGLGSLVGVFSLQYRNSIVSSKAAEGKLGLGPALGNYIIDEWGAMYDYLKNSPSNLSPSLQLEMPQIPVNYANRNVL